MTQKPEATRCPHKRLERIKRASLFPWEGNAWRGARRGAWGAHHFAQVSRAGCLQLSDAALHRQPHNWGLLKLPSTRDVQLVHTQKSATTNRTVLGAVVLASRRDSISPESAYGRKEQNYESLFFFFFFFSSIIMHALPSNGFHVHNVNHLDQRTRERDHLR